MSRALVRGQDRHVFFAILFLQEVRLIKNSTILATQSPWRSSTQSSAPKIVYGGFYDIRTRRCRWAGFYDFRRRRTKMGGFFDFRLEDRRRAGVYDIRLRRSKIVDGGVFDFRLRKSDTGGFFEDPLSSSKTLVPSSKKPFRSSKNPLFDLQSSEPTIEEPPPSSFFGAENRTLPPSSIFGAED